MQLEDLVLVSVDDHVVEPPDMFERHAAGPLRRPGPAGRAPRRRQRRLALRRQGGPQHRAQRRGRPPARGVRHGADVVRRDPRRAATTSTTGCGTWTPTGCSARCASRRSPTCAASSSPGSSDLDARPGRPAGLQRLAHRRVVRRRARAGSSRSSLPPIWDPDAMAAEVRRVRGQGLPRRVVLGEPVQAEAAQLPRRPLGPVLAGVRRRGHDRVPAHRLVVVAGGHRARRADRRAHHAAARQHRAGRRRPAVVAGAAQVPRPARGAVRGRHRLDPVLLRPDGLDLHPPPRLDRAGLRRPSCPSEVFPERIVTCFIDDPAGVRAAPPRGHRRDVLGGRLPALGLDLAHLARDARGRRSTGVPDDEIDKITHRNAMRHFRFDPFAHRPQGAVHGGRAAGRGRRRGRDAPRPGTDPRGPG